MIFLGISERSWDITDIRDLSDLSDLSIRNGSKVLSCAGDGLNDDGINWNRSDTVGRLDMIRVDFPIAGLGSREYVVHIGTLW